MFEEFLQSATLRLRTTPDTLTGNDAGLAAVPTLRSHTVFSAQPEALELEHAWGIHFEERWDTSRIASTVFGIFILASLFGVYRARSRPDVQGAFGISAYIITLAGIVVSMMIQRDMLH